MKRSKYNVTSDTRKRTSDKIIFDSELEMRYYNEVVKPKVANGEICKFELQKSYVLQPKFKYYGKTVLPITYIVDFYLEYTNGEIAAVDVKGCVDTKAAIKRKLFCYNYPNVRLEWIGYSKIDGGWVAHEAIAEGRKKRKKLKSID